MEGRASERQTLCIPGSHRSLCAPALHPARIGAGPRPAPQPRLPGPPGTASPTPRLHPSGAHTCPGAINSLQAALLADALAPTVWEVNGEDIIYFQNSFARKKKKKNKTNKRQLQQTANSSIPLTLLSFQVSHRPAPDPATEQPRQACPGRVPSGSQLGGPAGGTALFINFLYENRVINHSVLSTSDEGSPTSQALG